MSDLSDISLAFMANRPGEAARALELLPIADVSAFLAGAPANAVGPIIKEFSGERGIRVLMAIEKERASDILKQVQPFDIAFILRAAAAPEQEALMALLPQRLAARVRQLLAYSPGSIGAQMRSDFFTLSPDVTVAQAFRLAQDSPYDLTDPVFLVGDDRAYAGAVPLSQFFRSRANRKIRSMTLGDLKPLFDKSSLQSVAELPVWAVYNRVPVVDARSRFVGVLFEKDLRNALAEEGRRSELSQETAQGAVMSITDEFTKLMIGALGAFLGRR